MNDDLASPLAWQHPQMAKRIDPCAWIEAWSAPWIVGSCPLLKLPFEGNTRQITNEISRVGYEVVQLNFTGSFQISTSKAHNVGKYGSATRSTSKYHAQARERSVDTARKDFEHDHSPQEYNLIKILADKLKRFVQPAMAHFYLNNHMRVDQISSVRLQCFVWRSSSASCVY